jgi:predicted Zn-dependent peptidase
MINYSAHTLKNGMRVFLAPMQETQAATILVVFGVGSRFETAPQNGLSHFLEHMFFKGTEKRPTTLDISQELDSLGASYNAYTGAEKTGYYVSAAGEHFPIAFDVLTDMLYGSVFDEKEIEREKGVICEEIKMYHDDPISYLDEIANVLIFGDSPLGRDTAGTAESVKSFNRDDFLAYREQFYGPQNTVLVVAGNPGGHNWLETIEKNLSSLEGKEPKAFEPQALLLDSPTVSIGNRAIDQVNINLMHYGITHSDPEGPIFDVLSNILGGTMSSRLFVEVREKRGLAYRAWSAQDRYTDIGTFDCTAGVALDKLDEALTTIIDEIDKMKNEPVSDLELERAKRNIKGRMSLRLEDSHSIAYYLAYDALELGKIEQPEEYIAKVEKVTQSDIMRIAKQYLVKEKRKLALVGPLKKEDEERLVKLINR